MKKKKNIRDSKPDVAINTPEQNIVSVLTGKKVLFLENDTILENGLDEFENILKRNNIEYKVLFDLSELSLEDVIKEIGLHDAIVFQTQWVYDVSKKLREYMFASKDKKIAIEVYISEPTWYYKLNVVHDMYIYSYHDLFDESTFYKLTDTPYWDYKNQFDK